MNWSFSNHRHSVADDKDERTLNSKEDFVMVCISVLVLGVSLSLKLLEALI